MHYLIKYVKLNSQFRIELCIQVIRETLYNIIENEEIRELIKSVLCRLEFSQILYLN